MFNAIKTHFMTLSTYDWTWTEGLASVGTALTGG